MATPNPPVTAPEVTGVFCCRGCLETYQAESADRSGSTDPVAEDRSTETVYLGVDGMHCATCESFIEQRATDAAGILEAAASYPAGIVKLTYDPLKLGADDLPSIIDGLGYRAHATAERAVDAEASVGRLLVGGFFGMMVMVWYALFLYPAYLGIEPGRLLLDVTGPAGWYLLGNVWVMSTVVLGYTGYPLLRGAYVSLRARAPNMDLLVSLAAVTAYGFSVVTVLTGDIEVYFDIAVVIVLAVTVGNHYESHIRHRAAGRLATITETRVEDARRRTAEGLETVAVDELVEGDRVVVRAGERLPTDGTVVEGTAAVDESLVTGESMPKRREPADEVVGGARVVEGGLVAEVGPSAESTLDRLTDLLWEVSCTRSGTQALADRIAAVYVPLVIGLAALAAIGHLVVGATPTAALLTGLAVLVVSCPCALGLATPLAIAAGIGRSLEEGIVVTEGSVFERASEVDTVAFDKTGTLTTGRMRIVETAGEGLAEAAAVEQFADHPVADAVVDHVGIADRTVVDFEQHPGRGVSARVDGRSVVVGRREFIDASGGTVPESLESRAAKAVADGYVPVLVAIDGRATGLLVAGDEPRPGWERVVADLAADRRVVVISGDTETAARFLEDSPAIDDVYTEVPPDGKTEAIESLKRSGTVAMVGDGSNDAPALAAADVGIALEEGTQLAATAADAVIVTDDLAAVPRVFALTAATRQRIRENLGWAFLYNVVAIPLALVGLINPLFAALAMASSSLLVVGNSARSLGDSRSTAAPVVDSEGGEVDPAGRAYANSSRPD